MSAALALALLLAVLIGVSLGTLGSGGSIITMPVLVYVAGIPAHTAVGMSLVIVGTTAAAGSVPAVAQRGIPQAGRRDLRGHGRGRRLRGGQAHAPGGRRHADGDLRGAHAAGRLEDAGATHAGQRAAGVQRAPLRGRGTRGRRTDRLPRHWRRFLDPASPGARRRPRHETRGADVAGGHRVQLGGRPGRTASLRVVRLAARRPRSSRPR